jgi:predicted aminopeptidase
VNNDDFMRFMASWALVHETADEGWKAAVLRGAETEPGEMGQGPEAFVDGLSAMIAERKEQLKAELASGASDAGASKADTAEHLDELRFEVAEMRGRLESLQASLDSLLARTEPKPE